MWGIGRLIRSWNVSEPISTPAKRPPEPLPLQSSCLPAAAVHVLGANDITSELLEVRTRMTERHGPNVDKRIPEVDWARWGVALNAIRGSRSVLDVGTGHGAFINAVAAAGFAENVAGVDIRDYSLFGEYFSGFRRILVDAEALPFQDREFETVVCMEVLEHLPTPKLDRVLRELRRVAGRRLVVTLPFYEPLPIYKGHCQRFDPARLTAVFPRGVFTLLVKTPSSRVPWIMIEEDRSQS